MLDTANKPACQSNLLAPFDVNVRLKRNLSIGWSKTKTAIHLESQMEAIKVDILFFHVNSMGRTIKQKYSSLA